MYLNNFNTTKCMPKLKNLSKRLIVGLTGKSSAQIISKVKECNELGIKEASLFLEIISIKERKKVYAALKKSRIKKIQLIHIRNDMKKLELDYLEKEYKPKYLTIHESSLKYFPKWNGYLKKLYLELDYNNHIPKKVKMEKIAGFCIDLSHFKASEERWTREFEFITKRKKYLHYFKCNHINGYTPKGKKDIHRIRTLNDFEYLKTLPKFIFGEAIAMEMFNPIKQQIEYKKHITNMLN